MAFDFNMVDSIIINNTDMITKIEETSNLKRVLWEVDGLKMIPIAKNSMLVVGRNWCTLHLSGDLPADIIADINKYPQYKPKHEMTMAYLSSLPTSHSFAGLIRCDANQYNWQFGAGSNIPVFCTMTWNYNQTPSVGKAYNYTQNVYSDGCYMDCWGATTSSFTATPRPSSRMTTFGQWAVCTTNWTSFGGPQSWNSNGVITLNGTGRFCGATIPQGKTEYYKDPSGTYEIIANGALVSISFGGPNPNGKIIPEKFRPAHRTWTPCARDWSTYKGSLVIETNGKIITTEVQSGGNGWYGGACWVRERPKYIERQYIYTTGSDAVFDLECKVDGDSKWVLDYVWRRNGSNQSQVGADYFLWVVTETNLRVYNGSGYSKSSSGTDYWSGYRYTQTIDQKTGTAEGIYGRTFSGIRNAGYDAKGYTLYIGGRNDYGSGVSRADYKHPYTFYSSQLYNGSGTLVSDVVPCILCKNIRQDGNTYTEGTLGLWDKVTNRFLPKYGSSAIYDAD